MMVNFSESGHPIFRASGAFERGEVRSEGHGKKSVHFNGCEENIELLLRTVISANQLSVFGARADLCKEVSEDSRAPGKSEAPDHLETMETPVGRSTSGSHTNEQRQGNLVQDYERKFEQLSDDQKLSKLCSDAGLKIAEVGQHFFTLFQTKEMRCNIYAENTQCFDTKRRLERKDGFSRIRESVQSWT